MSHLRKSSDGFAAISSFFTTEVTTLGGAGEREGVAPFAGGLVATEGAGGEETAVTGRAC